MLRHIDEVDRMAGALAIVREAGHHFEVLSVHNTPSMCFGYMSTNQRAPKTMFSKSNATRGNTPQITVTATAVTSDDR